MMGPKLGYCPNDMYFGLECIFKNKPISYSIVVESDYAILLTTRKYDVMEKFSKDVRDKLEEK